jgi:hypothetical protein
LGQRHTEIPLFCFDSSHFTVFLMACQQFGSTILQAGMTDAAKDSSFQSIQSTQELVVALSQIQQPLEDENCVESNPATTGR